MVVLLEILFTIRYYKKGLGIIVSSLVDGHCVVESLYIIAMKIVH